MVCHTAMLPCSCGVTSENYHHHQHNIPMSIYYVMPCASPEKLVPFITSLVQLPHTAVGPAVFELVLYQIKTGKYFFHCEYQIFRLSTCRCISGFKIMRT